LSRRAKYATAVQDWYATPVTVTPAPVARILLVVVGVFLIALDTHRAGVGWPAAVGAVMVAAGAVGLWWKARRR
jgi:membrane-bound ClpP family serine protease